MIILCVPPFQDEVRKEMEVLKNQQPHAQSQAASDPSGSSAASVGQVCDRITALVDASAGVQAVKFQEVLGQLKAADERVREEKKKYSWEVPFHWRVRVWSLFVVQYLLAPRFWMHTNILNYTCNTTSSSSVLRALSPLFQVQALTTSLDGARSSLKEVSTAQAGHSSDLEQLKAIVKKKERASAAAAAASASAPTDASVPAQLAHISDILVDLRKKKNEDEAVPGDTRR